jgi:hypothetical protein
MLLLVALHLTTGTCDSPLLLLDVRNTSVISVVVAHTGLRVEIIADHAVQRELLSGHIAGKDWYSYAIL